MYEQSEGNMYEQFTDVFSCDSMLKVWPVHECLVDSVAEYFSNRLYVIG